MSTPVSTKTPERLTTPDSVATYPFGSPALQTPSALLEKTDHRPFPVPDQP